jgi:hypothetical protein
MVLTEEKKQDVYPAATLEGSFSQDGSPNAVFKEKDYYSIDSTKIVAKPAGMPSYHNNNGNPPYNNNPNSQATDTSAKVYKLEASSNGGVTGLGMSVKVMAGDRIDIFAKSYWAEANSGSSNYAVPVLDILNGLLGAPTGAASGKGATGSSLNGIAGINSAVGTFLGHQDRDDNGGSTNPRAYVNWILFDDN